MKVVSIRRWSAALAGVVAAFALAGPALASAQEAPTAHPVTVLAQDHGIECVDVNTADFEELQLLRHIGPDRAQQILDQRPFSDVDDLGRVVGLRAGGPRLQELVHGGGDWLPLCPFPGAKAPDGQRDALPVTGVAVPALIGSGLVLGGVGAGAVLLARRRRPVFVAG